MANKLTLTALGITVAIVVNVLFQGNYLLGVAIFAASILIARWVGLWASLEIVDSDLDPMSRLMTPFVYLSTLDTTDVEAVGTYIYDELDLDARSELSDPILSELVESQELPSSLAQEIRMFRTNVILKIDERVKVNTIGDDPEWRALLDESRQIQKQLAAIAG